MYVYGGKVCKKCKNIWLFERKVVILRSIFKNNPIDFKNCRYFDLFLKL